MDCEDASPPGRRSSRQLWGGVWALDAGFGNSDEDTDTLKHQPLPHDSGGLGHQTVRCAPWPHTALPITPSLGWHGQNPWLAGTRRRWMLFRASSNIFRRLLDRAVAPHPVRCPGNRGHVFLLTCDPPHPVS